MRYSASPVCSSIAKPEWVRQWPFTAFTTLPSTLFNQVDVIKSSTASQTESGISGALNLHTYRPWDLPSGFTYSYSANVERGSSLRKNGPEASGLMSYNADGRWGLQVSADYSDTTRTNSN